MLRVLLPIVSCLVVAAFAPANDSPQFRGPGGQGHAGATRVPLAWSEDADNVAWRVEVAGLGWSSPVVRGREVWLTTAVDEGRSLRAIAVDVTNGKVLRDVEVFRVDTPGSIHGKNSHASPTPILEGNRVYVHFGGHGTACLSSDGQILWKQRLEYNHVHGPGGSPELVDGLLVISCDGGDQQFVIALDNETGAIRWRTERPENPYAKKFAFSTPLVIEVAGRKQIVSAGAGGVGGYDPQSGREIWRADYPEGYSVVPRPVFGEGLVIVSPGFDTPRVLAIRPDGTGNVTQTHVAWTLDRGAPRNASPLLVGSELYLVSDNGVASCVDAKTGEIVWQERLGGDYSASPFLAAGRIYLQSEEGKTTVVAPGVEFQPLAVNQLSGRTLATPTPIEGALLIRTDKELIRIDARE